MRNVQELVSMLDLPCPIEQPFTFQCMIGIAFRRGVINCVEEMSLHALIKI